MTTIIPRFRCVGGEIFLGDTPISLVDAEEMRLMFTTEYHAASNELHTATPLSARWRVAVHEHKRSYDLMTDVETAMEASRQWTAAAGGLRQ